MALSANPDMITQTQSTKDVSTADTFSQNYTNAGGARNEELLEKAADNGGKR